MKFLLIAALLTLTNADVSHLVKFQGASGYQYQNPPHTSYGVPQASVLGNVGQSVSYSSSGSASLPSLSLPSASGSSFGFNNGFSTASPVSVTVQGYNGFSTPSPSFQVSTPAPSVDFSNFQVSTPAPSVGFSNFQVSSPAPSVDLSGFQVSTPSSNPSVNLVQYAQPSSSYQFLSKLSQPSFSVPAAGFSSLNGAQFGSDASLNSGINFGSSSANIFAGKTSGGNLDDAFGVVTDAASGHGAGESDVSKNLYFFAAPEEPEEEIQAKVELPPVPPKKSYKIIFIKAPAYRNQASITIPAPPQNDEKTLVYVLVKKPEGQPKVKFQSAAPVQPSKPEVFFIKYKTQKEAEEAVAEIQSKHGASGHVIANLPAGAHSVVQSQGELSVSSTPSSLSFGGSDIGSVINGASVSSTPSSLSFGGSDFGSLNNFVSSTPSPLSFASGDFGSLNNIVSVSSTPTPLSYGSNDVGSLNNIVSVSSTPTPLSFGSNDVGSLNNIVSVSSTPTPLSFGGSFSQSNFGASPLGSFGGLSFDSLGANSFVSSTPAPASFEARSSGEQGAQVSVVSQQQEGVPQFALGQSGVVQSTTVAPSSEGVEAHHEVDVVATSEGGQHLVGESGIAQGTVGDESGDRDGESSQVAAGFASYGPPKY